MSRIQERESGAVDAFLPILAGERVQRPLARIRLAVAVRPWAGENIMEFEKLLRLMMEKGGSDLFITAGILSSMRVNGQAIPVTKMPLSPEQIRETVLGVMNEQQRRDLAENHECDFAISACGIGRFRVSTSY